MNRRNFLKSTALMAAMMSVKPVFAADLFSKTRRDISGVFSLDIITENPDKAVFAAERFIKKFFDGKISYNENVMKGRFTSDIVMVKNGALINYKSENSDLAERLRVLASEAGAGNVPENPWLISFSAGGDQKPGKIKIHSGDQIVKVIDISKHDYTELEIEGRLGISRFHLSDGAIRMTGAPCGHKTCMQAGAVSATGGSIVCIPNMVRAIIEGNGKSPVDAVTG